MKEKFMDLGKLTIGIAGLLLVNLGLITDLLSR